MTIKDIAKESGYSLGTVSRALNGRPEVSGAARKKILEVAQKHHFQLNNNAKHLKQQQRSGIAVLVKGTRNLLFAAIVEQLQGLIESLGYACLIYYIKEEDNEVLQALQVLRERHPQGILFLGSSLSHFERDFSKITVPCCLVTNSGEELGFSNLSSVSTDDRAAARFAVETLLGLGHRNIGILGGKMERSAAACTRFTGCEEAFRAAGLPFDAESQFESARFAMESGYEAMERLLVKRPDLTAVFAMSDVMAVGAIRAIRDRGLRVPEDISLMGFDGVELGQFFSPRLTTIAQDADGLARESVALLNLAILGETRAKHQRLPFQFVEGESAARREKGGEEP